MSDVCEMQTVAAVSTCCRQGIKQMTQICGGEQGNSTQRLERCDRLQDLVLSVLWRCLAGSMLEELAVGLQSPCNISEEHIGAVLLQSFPESVPTTHQWPPLLTCAYQASKVISGF